MKNTKIEAIRKSASVTARVLNVIRIILTVGAIIALVSGIICLCAHNADAGSVLYENGSVRILPPVSAEDAARAEAQGDGFDFINQLHIGNVMIWAGLNCIVAAALIAIVTVVIVLIRKMFIELKDSETPFTENAQKRLKLTGILVTIAVFMESVGIAAIVALSFWCLYCIFGYGVELQKNEDETL